MRKLTEAQKNTLRKECAKYGGDADYRIKQASGMLEIRGKIIVEDKPTIQTSFWFDDRDNPSEVYREIDAMDKEKYFIEENIKRCSAYRRLESLKECGGAIWNGRKAYFRKQYDGTNFVFVAALTDYDVESSIYGVTEDDALTGDELDAVIQFYLEELEKFKKRLQTYWKRYGDSKLRFSTYWANR